MSLVVAYLGILTVLIVALNARFFGELLGVMDDPAKESHKSHQIPTPLVGAVMIAVLAAFIIVNQYVFDVSTKMTGISVCTILLGILGFYDDKFRLSWQLRLGAITAIISALVWWVPELRLDTLVWSFGHELELGRYLGAIFSIACLVTLVIAFNMMDGFNGGVIGFSIIVLLAMAVVAGNPHRQALCLFLVSALGIMFVYNLKGEFFLGDGGAYSLGLLVGSVTLLTYNSGGKIPIYADTIFTWLALPTLDCLRVIVTRKFVSKSSPFYASRDHLHHILIMAIGSKMTLLAYVVTVSLYVTLTMFSDHLTYIVLLAEVVTLALLMRLVRFRRLYKS
jgi:UDP-GlcNAc:undecaprenyl-phosphate GlcNAc-1-phosphate transferase